MRTRLALAAGTVLYGMVFIGVSLHASGQDAVKRSPMPPALPSSRTGQDIYRAACASCHGIDGRGHSRDTIGFDAAPPDFTDCSFATAESDSDWQSVVHEGGPIRGLDRHMPAFGDALSKADIAAVVKYVRTFCGNRKWPQGDLNFPRAFFTEKAFPESETTFTTLITPRGGKEVEEAVEYEHRVGARGQFTVEMPLHFQQGDGGTWNRGLGDVELAYKRVLVASVRTGTIAGVSAIVTVPTGNTGNGLGDGVTVFEPVFMWDQRLTRTSFIQTQAGVLFPSNTTNVDKSAYVNAAIGKTIAGHQGFGRLWTPQVELLWARDFGHESSWDVVPQLQVSLSKLQHVRVAGGARIPVTQRGDRHAQLVLYLLWDWADGGFFEFWK